MLAEVPSRQETLFPQLRGYDATDATVLTNQELQAYAISTFVVNNCAVNRRSVMATGVAQQGVEKSVFDFYQGYLAVMYGVVATKGLENLSKFPSEHDNWTLAAILLFLGSFLTLLHFWYVCSTVDHVSSAFYRIAADRKEPWFQLLLLFDVLISTAFAGCTLAMFQAMSPDAMPDPVTKALPDPVVSVFVWLLRAAVLSLLYDLYSGALTYRARLVASKDHAVIKSYKRRIAAWIRADLLFVVAAAAMHYFYESLGPRSVLALGLLFVGCMIVLLLLDVRCNSRDDVVITARLP
jgi:hypothetical protein